MAAASTHLHVADHDAVALLGADVLVAGGLRSVGGLDATSDSEKGNHFTSVPFWEPKACLWPVALEQGGERGR